MTDLLACCMPDGSCVGYICTTNQFGECIQYYTCLANGGWPNPIYSSQDDITDPSLACVIGQVTNCGAAGRCNYGNNECIVTNPANCYVNLHGDWLEGAQCAPGQNYEIKMFPIRAALFPHHLYFSLASTGSAPFTVPGHPQGNPIVGTCYQPNPNEPLCGVDRPLVFQQQANCVSPEYRDQIGRLLFPRTNLCWSPSTGAVMSQYTNATDCAAHQGVWRWDGILRVSPATNFIIIPPSDAEGCGKFSKIRTGYGFWRPSRVQTNPKCVDKITGASLNYPNQAACESAGGEWRPFAISAPPKWSGVWRTHKGSFAGDEPENYQALEAQDYTGASEYDHLFLGPVIPAAALPQPNPDVPYANDPQAQNKFPFFDTRTQEVFCMTRDFYNQNNAGLFTSGAPYWNRSFGDTGQKAVSPGLRAIIARSSAVYQANLRNYCADGLEVRCPYDVGCNVPNCTDVFENVVRTFFGWTAPKTYTWDADPANRGWSITYVTHLQGWLAHDAYWMALTPPPSGAGICERPQYHWAAWYEGKTLATCSRGSDPNDPAFKTWVLTHDSGFGLEFEPKYSACNDAMLQYAGKDKALADLIYPPWNGNPGTSPQARCLFGSQMPPCLQLRGQPSRWYMEANGAPPPDGRYVGTFNVGLPHETTRTRFSAVDKSTFDVASGWARLAFSTGVPRVLSA